MKKASWDASSEEEDSKGSQEGQAVQRKKKKKLHEILAEKEAARELDEEEKAALKAAQEFDQTPEGKREPKLIIQFGKLVISVLQNEHFQNFFNRKSNQKSCLFTYWNYVENF